MGLVVMKFCIQAENRRLAELILVVFLIASTAVIVPLLNLVPKGSVINEQGESFRSQIALNTDWTRAGSILRNQAQYFNELFFDSVFIGAMLLAIFLVWLHERRAGLGFLLAGMLLPFVVMPLLVSSQQVRYFYHVFPFYYIALSLVVYQTMRLAFPKARLLYVMVPLVLPLAMTFYLQHPELVNHTSEIGNKEAHLYLSSNAGAQDIIISVNPATTHFYVGRVDYFFYQRGWKVFVTEDGVAFNKQIDVPWVSSTEELESIQGTGRTVWIVTDNRYPGRFSRDTVAWVQEHFELRYSSHLHPSRVYFSKKKEI
jgi:hypothetical protein